MAKKFSILLLVLALILSGLILFADAEGERRMLLSQQPLKQSPYDAQSPAQAPQRPKIERPYTPPAPSIAAADKPAPPEKQPEPASFQQTSPSAESTSSSPAESVASSTPETASASQATSSTDQDQKNNSAQYISRYFKYFSQITTFIYIYVFVPISLLVVAYILICYSINMIREENIPMEVRFRRGVATVFPFILSLYSVLLSEAHGVTGIIEVPFYSLIAAGLLIGFAFIYWISNIKADDELFSTLSCFVASLLFFIILTASIITRSFQIISFVFGFLFGVCIYVMRYGLTNLHRFSVAGIRFPRLISAGNKFRETFGRKKSTDMDHN